MFIFANLGFMWSPHLFAVFACIFLWGIQMAVIQNTILAMITDVTMQDVRGSAFGLLYFVTGVATLVANALGGLLWHYFSYHMTFAAGASLGLRFLV